jgi:signal transduction histidine kinase
MGKNLVDYAFQDLLAPPEGERPDATGTTRPSIGRRDLARTENRTMEDISKPAVGAAPGKADVGDADLKTRLRLCQKMETLGRLTGRVAHDFNNLLTVIRGYSDMLQDCLGEDDPLRANLVGQIQKAADLGATLTWQLLTYSRKPARAPIGIDLGDLVSGMDAMLRLLLNKNIELVLTLEAGLGRVQADPGQLEQVLVNLVLNARDAMPRGGRLSIETANVVLRDPETWEHGCLAPGAYVLLAVRDTGAGMDAETLGRLFEPFFTTKDPGRGTGLGLTVAWDIIQQNNGVIHVTSAPGQGTTVRIYLPRVA